MSDEHTVSLAANLLFTETQFGMIVGPCHEKILYAAWFIFAPVPLHSLAFYIKLGTFTPLWFIRLPNYLSCKSRYYVWTICVSTYLSLVAWIGLCVATILVGLPNASDLGTAKQTAEWAVWICSCHLLLVMRALYRLQVNHNVQAGRTWAQTPSEMAQLEYECDFFVLGIILFIFVVELGQALNANAFQTLLTSGSTFFQVGLVRLLMWFLIISWIADILVRILWTWGAVLLEGDFEDMQAWRYVTVLPSIESLEACSICLGNDTVAVCQMPCNHAFHRSCLLSWVRAHDLNPTSGVSCPLCRSNFVFDGYYLKVRRNPLK